MQFVKGLEQSTGKTIGIYPEIKAPWRHYQEGKDIASATLKLLKQYGYTDKDDTVYLQTFDFNELKRIKTELLPKMGMNVKLVSWLPIPIGEKHKRKKTANGRTTITIGCTNPAR
ncbi:glycerophosphodiester phosphodiesterase family protein [Neisseria weixii]|uniref:glycerophosphodiester phosphodiesterase family protein n=1 Tax=Neisseria weixii TaxID=1853276 RepID=UPI003B8A6396